MKITTGIALSALTALAMAGCGSDADADTTATGPATYRDSTTNQQGQPQQAQKPDSQTMTVELIVDGTGDLSGLEPACSVDGLAGSFNGLFSGDAELDESGVYAAAFASSEAEFTTPSGCEIPSLQISAVGEVTLRATIQATTSNCKSYCEAKARSEGEAMCGADPGAASCRATAEGEYSASCQTTCTTTAHVIVAESKLSAQAIAELNARSLTGAALGELRVDITFDRIEDSGGSTLTER